MRRTDHLPTAEVDGTQLVELPYVGGRFAMMFAVPGKKDGLPEVEKSLDAARFDRWVKALAPERVQLALPKFEVDPPESIALRDALLALGMKTPFDRKKADFTKIADPPRPDDRLFIGNVFHKAFVKVDEKGTEAAAATAVVMPRAGGAPQQPKQVTVDRPFLFFLRDRTSGMILFAGRVLDPGK
jgi:serpin B